MTSIKRRRLSATLVGLPACLGAPAILRAQSRQLTIALTVPPGTSSDILARLLGERLRARLNRPVVVESKSGGGGVIAIQYLKQFAAEGDYLLLAPSSAVSLLPQFMSKPPFDAERDLVPVCEAASAPHAITVNAAMKVGSFSEYIDMLRKDPKQGSVGTPSPAGLASLLVYQIRKSLSVDVRHVPYRGGAPLLTDLLGGQIPASASIMPDYLAEHRAGKLRILAHSAEKRSVLAPTIPTFTELGHPSLVAVTSFGFFAKAGTPAAITTDYAGLISEALASAPVVERLHQMGLEPVGGTPADYARKLSDERRRWAPLIKETGMTVD